MHFKFMIAKAKHTSSGDETPPIPEEELEQQKIEHERQLQKEKECQAREAEEVRKLDIKLLHQRAIEAEEELRREVVPDLAERGMNTSWSHQRLCDLQRQAARWRHSRPSIPDSSKFYRPQVLEKASSTHLTKLESNQSICDNEGIFIKFGRGVRDDTSIESDYCELKESTLTASPFSAHSVCDTPYPSMSSHTLPQYSRNYPYVNTTPAHNTFVENVAVSRRMRKMEMQGKVEAGGGVGCGRDGSLISRSESTISRCTPHSPLCLPESASVDFNPMPTIYR